MGFKIPKVVLEDLYTRFVDSAIEFEDLNQDYGEDFNQHFCRIEMAYWNYLDKLCQVDGRLKTVRLKEFASQLVRSSPTLKKIEGDFDRLFESWKVHQQTVPTYGAILLDPTLRYVFLVQGYSGNWGFPKGKMNHGESPAECAVREVFEETGLDIRPNIIEDQFIEHDINKRVCRLFVILGISRKTEIRPKTKKEIKSCAWPRIDSLPTDTSKGLVGNANAYFLVRPFMKEIRAFVDARMRARIEELMQPQPSPRIGVREDIAARKPSEFRRSSVHPSHSQFNETKMATKSERKSKRTSIMNEPEDDQFGQGGVSPRQKDDHPRPSQPLYVQSLPPPSRHQPSKQRLRPPPMPWQHPLWRSVYQA